MEVVSVAGGYLDVTDLDSNETTRHYYTGSEVIGSTLYIIDTELPTHCSMVPSSPCSADQHVLRATLDSSLGQVALVWGGWMDNPSGVTNYRVELSRLLYNSATEMLYEGSSLEVVNEQLHTGQQSYLDTVRLNEEGPYSIVLVTTDMAGNRQYARRIIVYDVSSSLMEDESKPLMAVSGVAEDGAYWHNSSSSPIIISGQGHFFNLNQTAEDWLAPVSNHTPPVPPEFDDEARRGTPNALGVVEMSYAVLVDQMGGQGVTRPASFPNSTSDLALERVAISPAGLADGDSVTIWFQARDFRFNFADERVLVHIDSSPPVVSGLGLVINGVRGQVLHGTQDLLDLNIEFQAADVHSGLYRIEWSIRTDAGEVGNGNVPITTLARVSCQKLYYV